MNRPTAIQGTMSRRDFMKLGGAGLMGAAFLGSVGCASSAASSTGVRELTYAYEGPEETTQGIAANLFQEKLEEVSSGAMTLRTYPAGALGGEPALLTKLRLGDIDLINSSTANAALVAPQLGVFSLHYIFESREHVKRVLTDQQINESFNQIIRDQVQGARTLTLYTLPLRNVYSNETEVRSAEDMEGQKIRVQATPTEDIMFGAYGAQTIHMAFPELYTSLQTGVMDMAENALTYYGANGHYEVAPVMSMTEHEGNAQTIWVPDSTWNSLTEEEQGWVQIVADEVGRTAIDRAFELEQEQKQEYEALGVSFIEDVDKDSFRKIAEPLQNQLATELGETPMRILERVRELR